MAQLALKNSKSTSIEQSAFFTNFGQHPNIFNILKTSSQIKIALKDIAQLKIYIKK